MEKRAWSPLIPARLIFLTLLRVYPLVNALSANEQSGIGDTALVPEIDQLGPLRTLTLWQLPKGPIRKVFLILEGRNILPYTWWDYSPSCRQCSALAENRPIMIEALSRNYAVVIPQSLVADGDWGDWPEDNPDLVNVLNVFLEWRRARGLENVPTVGLGISAGGRCMGVLGLRPGLFESMVHMITPGRLEAWEAVTSDYPPTFFIHMPKDTETAASVADAKKMLEAEGVPTGEARWYEKPLTPEWFSDSILGLNVTTSNAIFNALKANDSLVDENNYLKTNDFLYEWDNIVLSWHILPPNPEKRGALLFVDSVWQEIKVAYAFHATISRKDREMFAWFEGAYLAEKDSALLSE